MPVPLLAALLTCAPPADAADWPRFRGPRNTGVAPLADPPVRWDEGETASAGVRWKVPVPGRGTAAPVVAGDAVYLLTAVDTGEVDPAKPRPEDQPDRAFGITFPNTTHRFLALAYDRETGAERWRCELTEKVPHEGVHGDTTFAAASPVYDGGVLYCSFGSAGVFAVSAAGELLWERQLGEAPVGAALGEGGSPAVAEGVVIIVRDHAGASTIYALDANAGETLWERPRDEPNAWATPLVLPYFPEGKGPDGRAQVVTAASNAVRSYDLHTGEELWTATGLTGNVIPAPVADDRFVYCLSGYDGFAALAIPHGGAGDVTAKIAWRADRGTPYIPSPVLLDGRLWFTQSNRAILTVLDAASGAEVLGRTRLPGLANVYASPVAAAGRVYLFGRDGAAVVLDADAAGEGRFEVLATNRLAERIDATPAVAGDSLFVRGGRSLYRIAR